MHEAKILFDLLQSPDKIDWNALRNYVYDHAPEDYEGSWHDLLVTIFNRAYDLARLQTCQFPTGFSVKSLRLAWVDMLIQAVGSAAESWDDPVVYDRLRDNIIAGIKQRVHAKRAS